MVQSSVPGALVRRISPELPIDICPREKLDTVQKGGTKISAREYSWGVRPSLSRQIELNDFVAIIMNKWKVGGTSSLHLLDGM